MCQVATLNDIGDARRTATALGAKLGLDDAARSDLGIIVAEAATNAVRHGRGGQVVFRPLLEPEALGVEVLCLDSGSGMANVEACRRDGYSTAGTIGAGLGAIERLGSGFDIYSAPGKGTALVTRLRARRSPAEGSAVRISAVCLPKAGEQACGDGWGAVTIGTRTVLLVVDGLGHGPSAAEAAQAALRVFGTVAAQAPGDIIDALHRALRSTRGAAAAVAMVDPVAGTARFAGIGNISAAIVSGDRTRSLVSHNGIVGHQARRIQEFDYPWPSDGTLVLHSDGLGTHWRTDAYPGLLRHDPALLCGVLYRDFTRGRDDVTVLAYRS